MLYQPTQLDWQRSSFRTCHWLWTAGAWQAFAGIHGRSQLVLTWLSNGSSGMIGCKTQQKTWKYLQVVFFVVCFSFLFCHVSFSISEFKKHIPAACCNCSFPVDDGFFTMRYLRVCHQFLGKSCKNVSSSFRARASSFWQADDLDTYFFFFLKPLLGYMT